MLRVLTMVNWFAAVSLPSAQHDGGQAQPTGSDIRCASGAECRAIGEKYCSEGKDRPLGAKYFQLGCDYGDSDSCVALAAMLFGGIFLPQDEPKALQLYQRACELKDMHSCGVVAQMFERGSQQPGIVPADLPRAAQTYQRACGGGDACSCIKLADLYSHGRGVTKNRRRAKELTERGRKNGCDTRE
jgi:TPR repeat protein